MFLSDSLSKTIQLILAQKLEKEGDFKVISQVGGGSINECFKISFCDSFYFLKVNSASDLPGMFAAEARGLALLKQTETIAVPEVIAFAEGGTHQFLLLEWIEQGRSPGFSQAGLGRQLAYLHKNTSGFFGLDHDNYMGVLVQKNTSKTSWTEFFISLRLEPQLKLAREKNLINDTICKQFESLFLKLDSLYPQEAPALLHGDLWSGNYLIDLNGIPFLIDPAVAFGNREVDLAMTTLFGGFNQLFYSAYEDEFPLQHDWKDRLDLWNLYPILIHVNLFGTSYIPRLQSSLKHYA